MKLVFMNSKDKKQIALDIEPQATLESVRDELKAKHGFPDGNYNFIFKGKILKNPGPFSSIQENEKIIVFVKAEAPKPPQEAPQPAQPPQMGQRPQMNQRPQVQPIPQPQQRSNEQIMNLIIPILNSAIKTNLIEKIYQPENNFYNHPKEVNEICQILDESVCGIIREFLLRHFETTLRSFDIPADRILAIIGHRLPMIHRCLNDFDASLMELSDTQRQAFDRLRKLEFDPIIILDTFIACEYDEEKTRECLQQMVEENE